MASLIERYESIQKRLLQAWEAPMNGAPSKNRSPTPPKLIAVSKLQPAEAIEELYWYGHRDFGENYVQELDQKARILMERGCTEIQWHFIGKLQSNKTKALLIHKPIIHAVDSLKLAQEISKRAEQEQQIFIAVNIDREASKAGFMPEETPALVESVAALPHLQIQGLMCIPSPEGGLTGIAFQRLQELNQRCGSLTQGQLSMGMTQDFEAAIQEGSTHVRVGTAIFGERPTPLANS